MKTFRILLAFSLVSIVPAEAATTLEQAWTIAPGANFIPDEPTFALSATSNAERGIAYNPATGNVLITSRTTGTRVIVVDGATGAYKHQMSTSGVSGGGGAVLSMIGVGDDGVVYAANLVTAASPNLKIYRWASDAAPTAEEHSVPEVAWSGDPAVNPATGVSAGAQRWGDTLAVRGAGVNTQIAVGSGASPVAIFTTTNGMTFTPTYIDGVTLNGQCRGIAFGSGNTLYVRGSGNQIPVRRVEFSLSVNPGAYQELNQFSVFPLVNASGNQFLMFTTDVVNGWFAGFDHTASTATPDTVRIFDISGPAVAPVPLATANIPTNNANATAAGSTAMGGGRLYLCDTNNGVVAYNIVALESEPNQRPTVVIQSAAMRGATGLMDVVFRVNDPDDATVKTRALAFIDGQRSFAKLVNPSTFADGTGSKIGDTIATNTDHTLTWNVATDWNIDLGQIKFEILAMDNRGLLPLDWVTIPAANGQPELTISKNAPSEQEVLDALLWQYASGDPGLKLENGVLKGSASSGVFSNTTLYQGDDEQIHAPVYALKQMNLSAGGTSDVRNATAARASISDADRWHVIKKPDGAFRIIAGAWGYSDYGLLSFPQIHDSITTIAVGHSHGLCLQKGGVVSAWGSNDYGKSSVPSSLVDVIGIAAGGNHSLALKADGTVIAWGANHDGQSDTPNTLPFVKAIAAGTAHSIALTNSGMVIGWGRNIEGQVTIPSNLPEITEIAASNYTNLAITINRTVVAWGSNLYGQCNVPADLSDVIKVAVGGPHCLALKADGTVRAWGLNHHGQCNVPAGLPKVIAIAAGESFSLALTINGDVVGWGDSQFGQAAIPSDLGSVTAIAAGGINGFAIKGNP